MSLRLYDAHNHLQDARLSGMSGSAVAAARKEGLAAMVVNGSCEEDWAAVLDLAKNYPEVIPSLGYHPWYVRERTARWAETLAHLLDNASAAIGEIGLDRWIKDFNLPAQQEVFSTQMRMAADRNLPASIHCLKAWGLLYDLLKAGPRPECGFILHSFGGPVEMVEPLTKLGAYFSLPGYFAHERKGKQRDTFRQVPLERLLIETDAPDQLPPPERILHPAQDAEGKPIHHPANIRAVYDFAAELLEQPIESLALQVEQSFQRLFSRLLRPDPNVQGTDTAHRSQSI